MGEGRWYSGTGEVTNDRCSEDAFKSGEEGGELREEVLLATSLLRDSVEESAPDESGRAVSLNLAMIFLAASEIPNESGMVIGGDLKRPAVDSSGNFDGALKSEIFSSSALFAQGDVLGGG